MTQKWRFSFLMKPYETESPKMTPKMTPKNDQKMVNLVLINAKERYGNLFFFTFWENAAWNIF